MHDSNESLKFDLNSLPQIAPERDAWPLIQRRLQAGEARGYRHGVLGLAAALLLGLGVWLALPQAQDPVAATADVWMARSQALQEVLRGLDTRGRVLSGAQARTMALLQERLTLLDLALADQDQPNDRSQGLWRYRAALMSRLIEAKNNRTSDEKTINYLI